MDKTPQNHGEFYFEPDIHQWRDAALQNREQHFNMPLWGQKASKVRSLLKIPVDCPVVMTGHQPIFFYPGIWAKCLSASYLAKSLSGAAYHKITDTALPHEFTHFVPETDEKGGVRKKEVDFFDSKEMKLKEKATPYAFLPPPDQDSLGMILSETAAFGPGFVREAAAYFKDKILQGLENSGHWNQFHTHTLNLLDEISGTGRTILTGSVLWNSEPFLNFLFYWFNHLSEINSQYNESLEEYRKKYGITHKIEPVPNLKFEDWYFELPFWGSSKNHHRDTLWAKTDGKTLSLKVKGAEGQFDFHLDDFKREMAASPLKIWPKAIPQTLFCRMYLCDFFIHGIGGGVYEEVVDLLFEKTTLAQPPVYGVVSATYRVDPRESEALDLMINHEKTLEIWKRALEQNPEYLFTRREDWESNMPEFTWDSFNRCLGNESLKNLAQEKQRLLNDLKEPSKKGQAAKRIKELNGELLRGYGDVMSVIERGLLEAKAVKETRDVLAFREYPFFCFGEEVFRDMNEKIKHAFKKGWS